jgi:hypothetical protein
MASLGELRTQLKELEVKIANTRELLGEIDTSEERDVTSADSDCVFGKGI